MKVFEGRTKGQRVLIGIESRYLQVRSPGLAFGLSEVASFLVVRDPAPVLAVTIPSGVVEIEQLTPAEMSEIEAVLNTRRVITRDDIKEITRRDLQLQQVYQHIGEDEARLFYNTFGDRIIRSLKEPEIDPIEPLSNRKKAKFVLSNQLLLKIFFQLNLPFDSFVKELFSGFIFANQPETAVDRAVLAELGRGTSPLERLNAYSFLLQSTWDIQSVKRATLPVPAPAEVLNPNLIKNISETGPPPTASRATDWSLPATLTPPKITPGWVEAIKRVPIPLALLKRLRETSRLVAKSKTATELIRQTTQRLEQSFREEIRRKFSPEQGEVALFSVNRILPSRFLKEMKGEVDQSANQAVQ